MWTPPNKRNEPAQADIDFAIERLNAADQPEDVRSKLVERGMRQEDAAQLVEDLLVRSVYANAVELLNEGNSPAQVQRILTQRD